MRRSLPQELIYSADKFFRHPLGSLQRAFYKLLIAPVKYRCGAGYDAEAYWRDRFAKYGLSLRGAGDEGFSEDENRRIYEAAGRVFIEIFRQEAVDLRHLSIVEIGPGTGFYTQLLHDAGVHNYVALDVTDQLFPALRMLFPAYEFRKQDITTIAIEGQFDLILMMDVVEHIVEERRFLAAMANIDACLAPGGLFALSGIGEASKQRLFYVRSWSPAEIVERFPRYTCSGPFPYRGTQLLLLRKSQE